jgi:hypothetical protein
MADPEIVALRAKLTSRPRSEDYRQRRRDIDERGIHFPSNGRVGLFAPIILMFQAIAQSAAIALPCAALAQPSDYRITESTQACERFDMVHTSVQNAKRGIGGFRLGCISVDKGTEVRLIQREGDLAQIDFCTVEGCLRRWVLTSVLGPNAI